MEKLSFDELEKKNDWDRAVIVFKQECFDQKYTEEERSYIIKHNANYFQYGKCSNSLFGDCLDGKDKGVRLDLYMKSIPSDNIGNRWIVDYCYIIDDNFENLKNKTKEDNIRLFRNMISTSQVEREKMIQSGVFNEIIECYLIAVLKRIDNIDEDIIECAINELYYIFDMYTTHDIVQMRNK